MTTITEDRQRLHFDSSWVAFKWDEGHEFKGSMDGALHQLGTGVKAADVVAARSIRYQPKTLLVAEFKDFDHPNIPVPQRLQAAQAAVSDELMRDIIRKVIDTLTGATFAHDAGQQRCNELSGWRPALARATTSLLILVCVELPPSQAVSALAWTKALQQRFRWLGPNAQVIVTSSARPFQGQGVRYSL